MQSFNMWIRHLKGQLNKMADFITRMWPKQVEPANNSNISPTSDEPVGCSELLLDLLANMNLSYEGSEDVNVIPPSALSADDYLSQVHGGRAFHPGVRGTWLALNQHFSGHHIPYAYVSDFVARCAICQKNRIGMTDNIAPIYRHLKPVHHRSRVGVDRLNSC